MKDKTPEEFFKKTHVTELERKLLAASKISDVLEEFKLDLRSEDGEVTLVSIS